MSQLKAKKLPALACTFYKGNESYAILYDKGQGQKNVEEVARQNFFLDTSIVFQFTKAKEGLASATYKFTYLPADNRIHFVPTLQKYT